MWRRDSGPVKAEDLASGNWEVMVGDQVTPMKVQLGALYDPTSARVQG
ncbi:MAG TPA: hypothetical protein VIJ56_06755 [Acidimicrobiales bacterium]